MEGKSLWPIWLAIENHVRSKMRENYTLKEEERVAQREIIENEKKGQ